MTDMIDFNRDSVVHLLSKAGSIIEKYEAISRETGGNFNIFEIAGISTKETTICRVLHELLSPAGRHGQSGAYLEIFLQDCLGLTFNKAEVEKREYIVSMAQTKGVKLILSLKLAEDLFLSK